MRTWIGIALAAASVVLAAAGMAAAQGDEIDCTGGGECIGTPGSEFMQGGPLRDLISSLGGNDAMEGEGSRDVLKGGGGRDVLEGGEAGDVMRGGPGDDLELFKTRGPGATFGPGFFGDEGPDEMYGGGGDDYLEGEQGRDRMFGGSGRDYLDAINDDSKGTADKLDCGKGFDRYSAKPEDDVAGNCERRIPSPAPL